MKSFMDLGGKAENHWRATFQRVPRKDLHRMGSGAPESNMVEHKASTCSWGSDVPSYGLRFTRAWKALSKGMATMWSGKG